MAKHYLDEPQPERRYRPVRCPSRSSASRDSDSLFVRFSLQNENLLIPADDPASARWHRTIRPAIRPDSRAESAISETHIFTPLDGERISARLYPEQLPSSCNLVPTTNLVGATGYTRNSVFGRKWWLACVQRQRRSRALVHRNLRADHRDFRRRISDDRQSEPGAPAAHTLKIGTESQAPG